MTTSSDDTQVLLIVPKRDELRAVGAVFGFGTDEPHAALRSGLELWRIVLGEISVGVVLADTQGSAKVALATRQALDELDPAVAMCVGTAAGRSDKTKYLDTVLATAVLDASEWRTEPGGFQPQWEKQPPPPPNALHDIDDFVKRKDWHDQSKAWLTAALAKLEDSPSTLALDAWPCVHDGWVVTTGFLHQDPEFLSRIWSLHARLRSIDMETAGFVDACIGDTRRRPWFVVRAISDYGTAESKQDGLRAAAAAAAAAVTRSFIESGLRQAHPLRVDSKESRDARLSESNFFARLTMPAFLAEELPQRLGVTLDRNSLTAAMTVNDLRVLCGDERTPSSVQRILDDVREAYFTQKYMDYDDEADLRGYIGAAWADEVRTSYEFLGVEPSRSDILYVGVSTGRDLSLACPRFKSLRGVDLSTAMLERAALAEPEMTVIRSSAEDLSAVGSSSIDLYLSLRTYQSSLFDSPAALREATRVLRPGGSILLSIPGGFLDRSEEGDLRYVPGLLVPGSRVVDRGRPRRIADRLLAQLENLMFERVGFHQWATDLYVYARKRS